MTSQFAYLFRQNILKVKSMKKKGDYVVLKDIEIVPNTTLLAKFADSVDLKDGLLNKRVCTVKFPVVESYFFCNTKHTN